MKRARDLIKFGRNKKVIFLLEIAHIRESVIALLLDNSLIGLPSSGKNLRERQSLFPLPTLRLCR